MGVQLDALESPVAGLQEHVAPPDPVSPVDPPAQIVAEPEAEAVGIELTVTVTVGLLAETQPPASVTLSV